MFFVYILKCNDGSYYVGSNDNIEKRLFEHQNGTGSAYTASKRPIKLLHVETFGTRIESKSAEWQIKGWSRKKKEAYMKQDWEELRKLAKKR